MQNYDKEDIETWRNQFFITNSLMAELQQLIARPRLNFDDKRYPRKLLAAIAPDGWGVANNNRAEIEKLRRELARLMKSVESEFYSSPYLRKNQSILAGDPDARMVLKKEFEHDLMRSFMISSEELKSVQHFINDEPGQDVLDAMTACVKLRFHGGLNGHDRREDVESFGDDIDLMGNLYEERYRGLQYIESVKNSCIDETVGILAELDVADVADVADVVDVVSVVKSRLSSLKKDSPDVNFDPSDDFVKSTRAMRAACFEHPMSKSASGISLFKQLAKYVAKRNKHGTLKGINLSSKAFTKQDKITAAAKLMSICGASDDLSSNDIAVEFTNRERAALMQGNLGKLLKKHGLSNSAELLAFIHGQVRSSEVVDPVSTTSGNDEFVSATALPSRDQAIAYLQRSLPAVYERLKSKIESKPLTPISDLLLRAEILNTNRSNSLNRKLLVCQQYRGDCYLLRNEADIKAGTCGDGDGSDKEFLDDLKSSVDHSSAAIASMYDQYASRLVPMIDCDDEISRCEFVIAQINADLRQMHHYANDLDQALKWQLGSVNSVDDAVAGVDKVKAMEESGIVDEQAMKLDQLKAAIEDLNKVEAELSSNGLEAPSLVATLEQLSDYRGRLEKIAANGLNLEAALGRVVVESNVEQLKTNIQQLQPAKAAHVSWTQRAVPKPQRLFDSAFSKVTGIIDGSCLIKNLPNNLREHSPSERGIPGKDGVVSLEQKRSDNKSNTASFDEK